MGLIYKSADVCAFFFLEARMEKMCGALVVRGRAARIVDDGRCVVESIDQPGITTMPLPIMQGVTITEGSTVLYCEFADGAGAVLMAME